MTVSPLAREIPAMHVPVADAAALTAARPRTFGGLTLRAVWLLAPALAMLMMLNSRQVAPNDFWWHMRTGAITLTTGAIPSSDLFTFTRTGATWLNQSWVMQVLLYVVYQAGGLPLTILVFACTTATGYLALQAAALMTTHGSARPAALATLLAAAIGMANWTIRPQYVSFLCFGILVWFIEGHRLRASKRIWLAPLLFAAWGNLHGGFVFGLGLLGLYVATALCEDLRERRKPAVRSLTAMGVGLLSCLALGLNPVGLAGMAAYIAGFFNSGTTQNANAEFLPLSLRQGDGLFVYAISLAFIVLAYYRRVRFSLYTVVSLLAFGLFTLYSRRVAPWYGMVAAPAVAVVLAALEAAPRPGRVTRNKPLLNGVLIGLLSLGLLGTLPWLRPLLPIPAGQQSLLDTMNTPVRATQALCQQGPGTRVFNDMVYGSYVAWACPAVPVFIDTRVELYSSSLWEDYLLVTRGQWDWAKVLERHGVNAILAQTTREKQLIAAARSSAAWQVAYEDEHAVLFLRHQPQ